jgi:hypothetical protein
MTGEEIRKRIIENNKIIEQSLSPTFVLNRAVQKAIEDNKRLQSLCDHEYDDLGYCIYCDKEKD